MENVGTPGMSTLTGKQNKLPNWKGFNLLDFFWPDPRHPWPKTTEDHFRWMRDWGFDFVRLPIAYPNYLNIDRKKDITPEGVYQISEESVDRIDALVLLAMEYNMHVSLNLHRAPGYCINTGFNEPYNLWKDNEALEALCFHWTMWAKRYKGVSRDKISFDLINEPCMRDEVNNQHSKLEIIPGEIYRRVVKASAEAIHKENPDRIVIADGNGAGSLVVPEIADLDVAQSCRGYNPMIISHYKAPWVYPDPENLPEPKWPGAVGDRYLSRAILEEFYKPWIELAERGVGIHCGECGAWIKTPHAVFLAWFKDVLDILHMHKIGFALWEFSGAFGVLNSGRTDVAYEDWYGNKLDKKLLRLIQKY